MSAAVETAMPRWADALISLWMLFVAALYFGGFFVPRLGVLTTPAGAGYALMLLISVGTALAGRLGKTGTPTTHLSSDTENDHG